MKRSKTKFNNSINLKCQLNTEEEEKVKPQHQDQWPRPPEPDFSSQSVESPDSWNKEDTHKELEPVPQSTLLPSLSTSPPRSSSSPVTPPRITRRQESSQDTSNSLSETTKSSTDSSRIPPSPQAVFSHTSTASSSRPQTRRVESENCLKFNTLLLKCLNFLVNINDRLKISKIKSF